VIPLFDLSYQNRECKRQIDTNIADVMHSGEFIGGSMVERFECAMRGYLGVKHAIGVANGTDALTLILRALCVGAGDEVITTSYSFWATAEAILNVGATPVFVDIGSDYNIDTSLIEAAVTPATKCILPVHLFGRPCDMTTIMDIAQRHNLYVVEDACQAIGAAGICVGHAAAFSFYPTKNLGAFGDGGMVTTNDDAIAERIRHLANHCSVSKYVHDDAGVNSRLDAIQAAVLLAKLPHLDGWNAMRAEQAAYYDEALGRDTSGGVHHLYVLTEQRTAPTRSKRYDYDPTLRLTSRGIGSGIFYPLPLHKQPAINSMKYLPNAQKCAGRTFALPLYPGLARWQQCEVIQALCAVP